MVLFTYQFRYINAALVSDLTTEVFCNEIIACYFRSQSRSSRRRHGGSHQRRSETSEEEDLDQVSSEEDEDFFTGVCFVGIKGSGSNSLKIG